MPPLEIERAQKIACHELNTGKKHAGFFLLDNETITAEICSYDEPLELRSEKPVFLRTQNNQIVSLHSNFTTPRDWSTHVGATVMESHTQRIISNTAVIGYERWHENDKIKRVTFRVARANDILKHTEKFDKIVTEKKTESLFSESVDDMTISAGYEASFSFGYNASVKITPSLEIEFDKPRMLANYLADVARVVQFLSLSLGAYMKPSDIKISKLSREELRTAVKAGAYPGDNSVEYVWPEIKGSDHEILVGGPLFTAWDNEELRALREALITWVRRNADWKNANDQMMHCLASKHEISPDRLLAACKWFEEIPLTKARAAITEEHIAIIAETASLKASELGYSNIRERIAGALKPLRMESNEQRFSRLVEQVRERFGPSILGSEAVNHLKNALAFRGKSAHGHYTASDDAEFRNFVKSIYAVEALCFLLMALDLPIAGKGIERANSNQFITDYRMC